MSSPVQFQGPTDPDDWVHLHPCYCSNVGAPYTMGIGHEGATVVFWLDNKLDIPQTVNINVDVHYTEPAVWNCMSMHRCFEDVMVEPGCHMIKLDVPLPGPWVGPQVLVEIDFIFVSVYLAGYTPAWSVSVPEYREQKFLPGPVGDLTGPGWPPPTPVDSVVDMNDIRMFLAHVRYYIDPVGTPLPYPVYP